MSFTISDVNTAPAQAIFQRYLERLAERTAYVTGLLKTEHFEFVSDGQYQYDRKDVARPLDLEAAHEAWRQNLRFEYLQEKLAGKKDEDIAQVLTRRANRLMQTMRTSSIQKVPTA